MSAAKPAKAKPAKLIYSRRSCIGCGLKPGMLDANGLCADCQEATA